MGKENIEEMKFYHNLWYFLELFIDITLFIIVGILIIQSDMPGGMVIGIICLLFCGVGLFTSIYTMIKERLYHTPFLKIYDDSVEQFVCLKNTYNKIMFADVEQFKRTKVMGNVYLSVIYKPEVLNEKICSKSNSFIKKLTYKFNMKLVGSTETISNDGLTMKKDKFAELLNVRLENYKNKIY